MNETTRDPALERLDALVGDWSVEVELFGDVLRGNMTIEWELGGQFLLQRSSADHPAAPDGLCIISPNASGEGYTQHYFDSRGVVRLYEMTLADGVWTLRREKPDFTPLNFSQRFTGTFSDDGNTIESRFEKTNDDGEWELDFELTYRRVA